MDTALIQAVGKTANNRDVQNKDARSHRATDTTKRWRLGRKRSKKDQHRIIVAARAENETNQSHGLGKGARVTTIARNLRVQR